MRQKKFRWIKTGLRGGVRAVRARRRGGPSPYRGLSLAPTPSDGATRSHPWRPQPSNEPFQAPPGPSRGPSRPLQVPPGPSREPFRTRSRRPGASAVFEYLPRAPGSPQIWGDFPLHSLGIQELSILLPQGLLSMHHQARSEAWGFVANRDPQAVEKNFVHIPPPTLSTGIPQLRPRCPQQPWASPHPCPLFGNTTPLITTPSERRHIERRDWAVGNLGKAGDSPGENHPCSVHRLCRTFGCPQKRRVVHSAPHRTGGQKIRSDLRKRRYPRFPQPLLLPPLIVSSGFVWKRGLCTTRRRRSPRLSSRLDPEQQRLSVRYVRLVPGVLPPSWPRDPIR